MPTQKKSCNNGTPLGPRCPGRYPILPPDPDTTLALALALIDDRPRDPLASYPTATPVLCPHAARSSNFPGSTALDEVLRLALEVVCGRWEPTGLHNSVG